MCSLILVVVLLLPFNFTLPSAMLFLGKLKAGMAWLHLSM